MRNTRSTSSVRHSFFRIALLCTYLERRRERKRALSGVDRTLLYHIVDIVVVKYDA